MPLMDVKAICPTCQRLAECHFKFCMQISQKCPLMFDVCCYHFRGELCKNKCHKSFNFQSMYETTSQIEAKWLLECMETFMTKLIKFC